MKSIKTKILVAILSIVTISLLVVGLFTGTVGLLSNINTIEDSMISIAQISADRVGQELARYKAIASEAGCNERIASDNVSNVAKRTLIEGAVARNGFLHGGIIDVNGTEIFNKTDHSGAIYFQQAMTGYAYITEPIVDPSTGNTEIIVAAPLWKNGITDTQVIGVVYFAPPSNFLNEIMKTISVSENSVPYILNSEGYTIADRESELVSGGENVILQSQTDPSLVNEAYAMTEMLKGEPGVTTYQDGEAYLLAYSPIKEIPGWYLGIDAPRLDFTRDMLVMTFVCVGMLIISIIIAAIMAIRISNRISKPITLCVDRLELLAEGDIHTPAPEITAKDETGKLAEATDIIIKTLGEMIEDIRRVLGAMAKGDLTCHPATDYPGDLTAINTALYSILKSLNDTMLQMDVVSSEVAAGAGQVSDGAQNLSQGATEQASAIEELSATIAEVSEQIRDNSNNAKAAGDLSNEAGVDVEKSSNYMNDMTRAMSEIAATSNEIGKIIKTIEDIAFQTNILALNAAVEAARAGEAGKGFAVVADEVRNLAGKSAEAANNTTTLIENAIAAINNGAKIARYTAESLDAVVTKTNSVNEKIQNIALASDTQATAVMQITQGIEQISAVVQNNSATAEQSAAASEQLSGQAQTLKQLIDVFTLVREDSGFAASSASTSSYSAPSYTESDFAAIPAMDIQPELTEFAEDRSDKY